MKLKNCAHALELLQRTDPLIAAEAIDQHITITHQPGGMASLTAGEDPPWNITITVDSNGILQTKGDTFQLVNMTLPNPRPHRQGNTRRHPGHQAPHTFNRQQPYRGHPLTELYEVPVRQCFRPMASRKRRHPMDKQDAPPDRNPHTGRDTLRRIRKRRAPTPQPRRMEPSQRQQREDLP